jgi:hypothetical protein
MVVLGGSTVSMGTENENRKRDGLCFSLLVYSIAVTNSNTFFLFHLALLLESFHLSFSVMSQCEKATPSLSQRKVEFLL